MTKCHSMTPFIFFLSLEVWYNSLTPKSSKFSEYFKKFISKNTKLSILLLKDLVFWVSHQKTSLVVDILCHWKIPTCISYVKDGNRLASWVSLNILYRCGIGPLLVLASPCFRETEVVTCKIGSFLCSLDNLLQKNVIVYFFWKSNFRMVLIWKMGYFGPTFHIF